MSHLNRTTLVICAIYLLTSVSCKEDKKPLIKNSEEQQNTITNATGFSINNRGEYPVVTVTNPWPNAEKSFTYAFIPKSELLASPKISEGYDAVIGTPIENLVVTSTTHIPALEVLGGLDKLKGFPDTKYISSMPARQLISDGKIKELGSNETLNTEMLLDMRPDAVVGFAMSNNNAAYDLLQKAGIPILFNGDWTEQTPLGKAEWIKLFGVLLNKQEQAEQVFKEIEYDYERIKQLAEKATKKPTVLSGALYKDIWYLPAGESWAAQFIRDANAQYLWFDTKGTGSLSLSLEAVLERGQMAEFWVSPSQFKRYEEMSASNLHYQNFDAFKNKKIHTYSATTGPTGGLLFFELGPQRPDIILKDLVYIFHPELLPDHVPFFFQPLK